MKIMLVNSLYYPFKVGGAEVSVQLLAEGLVKHGCDVMVVTLTNDRMRHLTTEYINKVKVVRVYLKNIYWPFDEKDNRGSIKKLVWHIIDSYNPLMQKIVNKLVNDFSPDIIHTNNICGFSTSIWNKYDKIKVIHTIRDYYLLTPSSVLSDNKKLTAIDIALSWIKKKRISRVSCFIGISEYILKTHNDHGFFSGNEYLRKIYNSTILTDSFYLNKSKSKSGIFTIGFIGRLTEEKGYSIFYALADHYKNNKRIVFKAAGSGREDYLDELKCKYSGVNLYEMGHTSQSEFYNEIDLLIIPAKWAEPFGRTAIEAFSYAVPVLSSGRGGLLEINSILKQDIYKDFQDLIKKVDALIENNPSVDKSMVSEFNEHFSEKRYISQHLKLYSFLCNK